MTEHFAMSANVHHPIVKSVYRLRTGELSIQLGGNGYEHVSVITTDEGWRRIVRDADQQIARVPNPDDTTDRAAVKNETLSADEENARRRDAGEPSCGCGGYGDHDWAHEDA